MCTVSSSSDSESLSSELWVTNLTVGLNRYNIIKEHDVGPYTPMGMPLEASDETSEDGGYLSPLSTSVGFDSDTTETSSETSSEEVGV